MSNKDLYQLDALWLSRAPRTNDRIIKPEEFSDRVTKRVEETQLDDEKARAEILEEMEHEK